MLKKLNRILLWTYVRMGFGRGLMRFIMRMTHPKKPVVIVEHGWVRARGL